jgi:hypothetical protein
MPYKACRQVGRHGTQVWQDARNVNSAPCFRWHEDAGVRRARDFGGGWKVHALGSAATAAQDSLDPLDQPKRLLPVPVSASPDDPVSKLMRERLVPLTPSFQGWLTVIPS